MIWDCCPKRKFNQFKTYKDKVDKVVEEWDKIRHEGQTLEVLLRKYKGKAEEPYVFSPELLNLDLNDKMDRRVFRQVVIQAHYKGYLEREKEEIKKLKSLEDLKLPEDFDYSTVKGLRNEARTKLIKSSSDYYGTGFKNRWSNTCRTNNFENTSQKTAKMKDKKNNIYCR